MSAVDPLALLSDALSASGLATRTGWMISLPNIVVDPDEHGNGYLVALHASAADPDTPRLWGPGARHLGRADQLTEVAAIIRRDMGSWTSAASPDSSRGQADADGSDHVTIGVRP